MQQQEKGTVILFPRSIDYYQIHLTKLLEKEQYQEAMAMLQFLINCRQDDKQVVEEWDMLLHWLQNQFPEYSEQEDAQSESESELLQEHINEKTARDKQYTEKLVKMLTSSDALQKQILALEQLVYIDDPDIDMTIVQWLKRQHLHPIVQYKGLQTLKARDFEGELYIYKGGKKLKVDMEDIPSNFDDYPRTIQEILYKVKEVCEVHEPSLYYIVEQLWKEWLAFIFGTHVFDELMKVQEEEVPIWAAALHYTASKWVSEIEPMEEIMTYYGILPEELSKVEVICKKISANYSR